MLTRVLCEAIHPPLSAQGKAQVRVLRTVGELQEGKLVPSAKRLNPRQRKKLQQKAAADE